MITSANDDKGVSTTSATLPPSVYAAGSGGATYKPSGIISQTVTPASTPASTVETTLWSYVLPASTLVTNGDRLRLRASGSFASNGNAKTLKFKFGNTITANDVTTSPNGAAWVMESLVARLGAATQLINEHTVVGSTAQSVANSSPTATLSLPITISITGTNGVASAGDITLNSATLEYLPV